jgi:RimJ/RimL family protein N-acetyltransferase
VRVELRPAAADDLEALLALAADPGVAATLAPVASEQIRRAFAEDGAADPGAGEVLVIEVDGAFGGGVRWTRVSERSRLGSIGSLMVSPAVRGRGVGVAAVRALAARMFGVHGLHRAEAEVYGFNVGGLRTFERAGFVREGVRRQAWERDGWQDGVRFGLLADEL